MNNFKKIIFGNFVFAWARFPSGPIIIIWEHMFTKKACPIQTLGGDLEISEKEKINKLILQFMNSGKTKRQKT